MENKRIIEPRVCPVCGSSTNYMYCVAEGETVKGEWYRCGCGVIFQKELPSGSDYGQECLYIGKTSVIRSMEHAAKTYAPLIEELTYGRKLLDIGFQMPVNIDFFRKRGWIVQGLEKNTLFKERNDVYIGDFEEFSQFKDIYDVAWLAHVLEHFKDPYQALLKVNSILDANGIIFISTPDTEFIHKEGVAGFGHFKAKEHNVMFSLPALIKLVEKAGFEVVMARRNYCRRYSGYNDCHLIGQKKCF